jgi:hypothetical protein
MEIIKKRQKKHEYVNHEISVNLWGMLIYDSVLSLAKLSPCCLRLTFEAPMPKLVLWLFRVLCCPCNQRGQMEACLPTVDYLRTSLCDFRVFAVRLMSY